MFSEASFCSGIGRFLVLPLFLALCCLLQQQQTPQHEAAEP